MREVKREIVLIGTSNMFYATAFKEACLVNIKLDFKDWFFFIEKFKQNSTVFKKPDILSEKFETLTSSNYHRVEYFLLKFHTRLLFTNFI